ncbi:conserved domain protein [Klebsiella sp. MS 92-3]|nr:conserved domain protein [Klebsiella sp. MS 92-3]
MFSAARQTSPRGDLTGCRAGAAGGANPGLFRCVLPHHDGFFTCRAAGSLDEKAAGTLILQES